MARKPASTPGNGRTKPQRRILLIEPDQGVAKTLRAVLTAADRRWQMERAATVRAGLLRLAKGGIQVVLLSVPASDRERFESIVTVCTHAPSVPVLALVPPGDEMVGVRAVRHGAQDYLVKSALDQKTLGLALRYALERRELLSELERSIRQLQASEANLQSVIERSADGMVVVDEAGRIVLANPAAESLLGRSAPTLMGSAFEYPLKTDQVMAFQISRTTENIRSVEMRVVETTWEGRRAFLVSIYDVTERKRLERMKDEFVSTVSHELRTPLTSIKGAAGLMLNGDLGPINDEQKDFLKTITGDIDRLSELVSTLLDLSKVGAGKMALSRQRVRLPELVDAAIRSHQVIIGTRVVRRVLPKVPDVFADAGRVIQVLSNLLDNAIKFTKEEEGEITVELTAQPSAVAVTIADNGPGIPKEDQWRLFQKFEQVRHSWTERPKGTGLGLAICREIVDLHQGEITVWSELGKGTAFTFTLPIYNPSTAFAEMIGDLKASGMVERQGLSLLLVDLRDVRGRLEQRQGAAAADVLTPCVEAIRERLPRYSRVIDLEPTVLAVLAVMDHSSAETFRSNVEAICTAWSSAVLEATGAQRVPVVVAHYPEEGSEPGDLLQTARAKLHDGTPRGARG